MECYSEDTPKGIGKDSPIQKALNGLKNNIGSVQETMGKFESILASVISQPDKPPPEKETIAGGQTSLETVLTELCNSVANIDNYLRQIQNRIQL
jgi:hypothetical protein